LISGTYIYVSQLSKHLPLRSHPIHLTMYENLPYTYLRYFLGGGHPSQTTLHRI